MKKVIIFQNNQKFYLNKNNITGNCIHPIIYVWIMIFSSSMMSLEGNLLFKECGESLKSMKNGKSPGSDGFTVDFYKLFWKDIGVFVFRSIYFGHFSQFQTQGVITCIHPQF